jgi:hypothetical protein
MIDSLKVTVTLSTGLLDKSERQVRMQSVLDKHTSSFNCIENIVAVYDNECRVKFNSIDDVDIRGIANATPN